MQRLKSNADEVADEVARATAVLDMIRITESRASTVPLSDLEAIYARLQADYPNEYTLFDAPTIALGQLLPRLKREAARWAPLTTPAGPWLETFTAWKALLERPGGVAVFADHDDPTGALLPMLSLPGACGARHGACGACEGPCGCEAGGRDA